MSVDEGPGGSPESATIDLGDLDLAEASPFREVKARRLEDTRARLAFALLALLGGTLLTVFLILAFGRISAEELVQICGVVLAPLVGLVGAATGYYYGRSSR